MLQFEIHSLEETRKFARQIADLCRDKNAVICLDGDLGAGKTTWTKSFGKELGVKSTINSPTFTIMKTYKMADGRPLVHIDAYRLEGADQDLGFEESFEDGITVIEWGSFIPNHIPADHLEIALEEGIDENRSVKMSASGPVSEEILEGFAW